MGIFNFGQFLNEKWGVSEPSLQFVDLLEEFCLESFLEFYMSDDKKWIEKLTKISYRNIKPHIKDIELYKQFPVVGFEIIYIFEKMTSSRFNRRFPSSKSEKIEPDDIHGPVKCIAGGGAASWFGNKRWKWYSKLVDPVKGVTDHGVIVQITLEIDIDTTKFDMGDEKIMNRLKDMIGSTTYHELNHIFELYKRILKKKSGKNVKQFSTALTWAGTNVLNFPREIWKFWDNNFSDFIYKGEKHEMRSNIQEVAYFIKKYPDKNLDTFDIYNVSKKMIEFDSSTFYNNLLKEISKYPSYKGIEKEVAEKLKKMWTDSYKKQIKLQKVDPIISTNTLDKMDCLEFLRFWSKKINTNGKYFIRKINKLKYGIQNEKI